VGGWAPLRAVAVGVLRQHRRSRLEPVEASRDGDAHELLALALGDPHLGAVKGLGGLAQLVLARLAEDVLGRRVRHSARLEADGLGPRRILRELDHHGFLLHDRPVARRHQVRLARLDHLLGAVLELDAHLARLEVAEVGGWAPLRAVAFGVLRQHWRSRFDPVKAGGDVDLHELLALILLHPHLGAVKRLRRLLGVELARAEDGLGRGARQDAANLRIEPGRAVRVGLAVGRARRDLRLDHLALGVRPQRERLRPDLDDLVGCLDWRQLAWHGGEGGARVRAKDDDVGRP